MSVMAEKIFLSREGVEHIRKLAARGKRIERVDKPKRKSKKSKSKSKAKKERQAMSSEKFERYGTQYEEQLKIADEALRKAHLLAPKVQGIEYAHVRRFFVNAQSEVEQLIADYHVSQEPDDGEDDDDDR